MRILEDLVDYILNNIKPYPGNIEVAENTSYLVRLIKKFDKENNNGWIPVNERLPEENIDKITRDFLKYIVSIKFNEDKVECVKMCKFGNNRWWYGGMDMSEYVLAWQPLSKPYKEINNEINH